MRPGRGNWGSQKGSGTSLSLARVPAAWARRAVLAVVLAGAAVIPGYAAGSAPGECGGPRCGSAGKVLWTRPLPGSWIATDISGTALASGQAYAAAGGQVAAIGFGLTVAAFDVRTGSLLWTTTLSRLPAGASIGSVRAWPGVVTAGVAMPRTRRGRPARREIVLRASTGAIARSYPAAAYGGAVDASASTTVIVGRTSVTSYDNRTGRVRWRRRTGQVPQAWRVDGSDLYVTIAAGGYLGTAPVTGLRQISLRTGAQRVIRPHRGSFDGALDGAFDGVVLFSGTRGVTAYSGATGQRLWARAGVVPESIDVVQARLYLTKGSTLIAVNPLTGARNRRRVAPRSAGLYGVRGGVALGLDQGASGDVWGYDVARQRVIWTTTRLPWPHYFADLSRIGGSADAASSTVLITSCARLGGTRATTASPAGAAAPAGQPVQAVQAGQACLRPELVAIRR
jgi:outer membrane protein assembly factor BamB